MKRRPIYETLSSLPRPGAFYARAAARPQVRFTHRFDTLGHPMASDPFAKYVSAVKLQRDGQFHDAIKALRAAYAAFMEASKNGDEKYWLDWAARSMQEAAQIYLLKVTDPNSAIETSAIAARLYRLTGAQVNVAANLNNAGDAYVQLGRHAEALDAYTEAFELIRGLPYGRGHSITSFNVAQVLLLLEQPQEAAKWTLRGRTTAAAAGDSHWISRFNSLGLLCGLSAKDLEAQLNLHQVLSAGERVLSLERQFAAELGPFVHHYANAARTAGHRAASVLMGNELLRVSEVPVSGVPLGAMNAYVAQLSSEQLYVNISAELLLATRLAAQSYGQYLNKSIDHELLSGQLSNLVFNCAYGPLEIQTSDPMTGWFPGVGIWEIAMTWVALHEYGHIILGHFDSASPVWVNSAALTMPLRVYKSKRRDQEFEADEFATKRTLKFCKAHSADSSESAFMSAVSSTLGLIAAVSALRHGAGGVDQGEDQSTHPDPVQRLEKIKAVVCSTLLGESTDARVTMSEWEALLFGRRALAKMHSYGGKVANSGATMHGSLDL